MTGERIFREGRSADLRATFELTALSLREAVRRRGVPPLEESSEADFLEEGWKRQRPLLEFIAGQPDGEFWVCEEEARIVGYATVARFDPMDELSELAVDPERTGTGIATGLLERCWPERPTRERGRVVVTLGTSPDLTLYTRFGVMPVAGHWHLRVGAAQYMERRSLDATDATEPAVHVLTVDRAVEEWKRLEPLAIAHKRPALHEFFGRTRSCLAVMNGEEARALCWVSPLGEIGPAVGASPEDLLPVVLAALDRVAKSQQPTSLGVYCTTDSWWVLDRLRRLGFKVRWPSWVMSSVPLPGLDRYLPTRPALLL